MARFLAPLLAYSIAAMALSYLPWALAQTQAAPPTPAVMPPRCTDCGVVQSVRYVEQQGQTSGVGMVAGGILGGVLGHQIGSGRGNTVATVAGAAGGAYVGNQVEKNKNKKSYWTIAIKMDTGQSRTFTYSSQPTVHEGERVKLVDGGKRLALVAN
jgi:outer membrane lipoprotein SlyB